MSDTVIRVEHLGKRYRIGARRGPYKTLRESLVGVVTAPFRRAWSPHAGRQPSVNGRDAIWALKDVSFEIKRGEVVGVIGRNGAGKSTLLKILSRITRPTEGRAEIRGRVGALLEVGTGFHSELTGRENIYLSGAILGMRKAEIVRKLDEIVAFAEVEKFLDTPVKHYSSGMCVRLAFAVAAHLEPEILLADEVLAVGDAGFQKKCLGKMGDVAKEGRTVLFVSHNMLAVQTLCQKGILLEEGRVSVEGPVHQVVEEYLSRFQSGVEQHAEVEYADDPSRPAKILRIRVLGPDGKPTLRHHILDPVGLEVTFVVRRELRNLVVACSVYTSGGDCVYGTNEMDWQNYAGGEMVGTRPKCPGLYAASVMLPAPLLNAGLYELLVSLACPRREDVDRRAGIFLEVTDTESFASFPYKARRSGHVVVPIQWKVERLGDPETAVWKYRQRNKEGE
ncbi:MAG: ABC transporter ATP-binding protein [Desulfomonile tiedjei]|nr:ABC transporter ATP-binding protein [Desulfomonile tiedjei]